jgi:hypothetical protein
MKVRQLLILDLDKDLEAIVGLIPPEQTELATATKKQLEQVASIFYKMWSGLVTYQIDLSNRKVILPVSGSQEGKQLSGQVLWDRVVMTLVGYYCFALTKLLILQIARPLRAGEEILGTLPGVEFGEILSLLLKAGPDLEDDELKSWALFSTHHYVICVLALQMIYWLRQADVQPPATSIEFERTVHERLSAMSSLTRMVPIGEEYEFRRILDRRLLESAHYLAVSTYRKLREIERASATKHHLPGAFSRLRLGELALLAKRDPVVINKYGVKQIEKIFEFQLSLVMQSFGFYVASAERGERVVDLICISGDPRESLTMLLEAKTTTGPYSLPTKDERALRDYVQAVRRSAIPLPTLKLVLLVSYEPSKTLESKLKSLSDEISVPIRFCRAQDLAMLREQIPGQIPIAEMIPHILSGPHVLPSGFFENLVKRYTELQATQADYIRKILALRVNEPHIEQQL